MAIHYGSAKIGQLRIGAQNFKEAWVGSSKVYSSAKPTNPSDGIIFNRYGWSGSVTRSSNWGSVFAYAEAKVNQTSTISNVVFSPNTTAITMTFASSTQRFANFTLNGVPVPITYSGSDEKTGTITIPTSVPRGQDITIGVTPTTSSNVLIQTMTFNV